MPKKIEYADMRDVNAAKCKTKTRCPQCCGIGKCRVFSVAHMGDGRVDWAPVLQYDCPNCDGKGVGPKKVDYWNT